jgi:ABC-type glycerol-3-phosphate transport system substrate-binding protein
MRAPAVEQRHASVGCFFCLVYALSRERRNVIALRTTRGLLLCLLLVIITACASSNQPAATPVSTVPANVGAGSVTLTLWHGWSGEKRLTLNRLVDEYNRRHPNGRILAQSAPLSTFIDNVRDDTARGAGPHLMLIPSSWIGELAQMNVLLPLDDVISPAEREKLLPVTLAGAQTRTDTGLQLYGLPVCFDTLALFYNTANFSEPPRTTQDMIRAGALGDPAANPPRWGFALNLSVDTTIGYLYAFGGRVFDEEGALTLGDNGRAGAEQWLSWQAQLNSNQQLLTRANGGADVDRALKNQQVLMTFGWANQLENYRRVWGENMGIAPLPILAETDQPPQPYVQSNVLAVNSRVDDSQRRVASDFLSFMISEDTQRSLLDADIQPSRGDLSLDGNAPQLIAARVFRSQAERGQPMPNGLDRHAVRRELELMQQAVLSGRADPPTAVAEADARLRTALGLSQP